MKTLIGMLTLLLVTVYVWYQITMIQTGYEIQQLQQEQHELHRLHQALLIEAASLATPDRIERIATTQLGFKKPQTGQVILVRPLNQMPGDKMIKMAQTKEGATSRQAIR
jgi:cell division protein FtsL